MIFSRQGCEIFLWEIPSVLVASEKSGLNARGAVRKSPKFLLLSSAPASGGVLAEAGGTCKGSPLHSDR